MENKEDKKKIRDEMFREYRKNKSLDLRNEIVVENLNLVKKRTLQYCSLLGSKKFYDDLYQEGCLALMDAVDNYDPDRGNEFSTVAYQYILNAFRSYMRKYSSTLTIPKSARNDQRIVKEKEEELKEILGRDPSPDELEKALDGILKPSRIQAVRQLGPVLSLDQSIGDGNEDDGFTLGDMISSEDDPRSIALDNERTEQVINALSQLDSIDRDIILSRSQDEPVTLNELAKKYNMTAEAIRQREVKARKKIRSTLESF